MDLYVGPIHFSGSGLCSIRAVIVVGLNDEHVKVVYNIFQLSLSTVQRLMQCGNKRTGILTVHFIHRLGSHDRL